MSREEAIKAGERTLYMISYPDQARPADAFANHVRAADDRPVDSKDTLRLLMAVLTEPRRTPALARIQAPTLVIHGRHDQLVPLACGEDTAQRIAGARFEVIEAMAHDLPPSQMPHMADLIIGHAQSVEQGRAAAA